MNNTITFNGVTFRRYPEAKDRTARVYYCPHIADRQKGIGRLHEEMWKAHYGPIPEGCHIHHKDGDPLNNSVENLECLTPREHAAHHKAEYAGLRREHLDNIRPLAAEWHRSDEGRAWHRKHAKEIWQAREPKQTTCEHCGASYETLKLSDNTRFCSNKCRSAARRASGIDDEDRTCVVCGTTFRINRYAKAKTCSSSCGYKSRSMRP